MFGYVKVNKPELKVREYDRYKSFYCGLCHVLKDRYGWLGQMTLSYDVTFLVLVLSALYECEEEVVNARCKTHAIKPQCKRYTRITEYAADMNMLLTYYHLDDEWRDESSKKALAARTLVKRGANRAAKNYAGQAYVIKRELGRLSCLEEQGCTNMDELADCFGKLMGRLFVYKKDEHSRHLYRMGYYLGKFIYIMDAYDDLEKDEKSGAFNPLKDYDREQLDEYIRGVLNYLMARCVDEFEMLPIVQDAELIRNILYAGVWQRYNRIVSMKGNDNND